jgi:hypothetical protein
VATHETGHLILADHLGKSDKEVAAIIEAFDQLMLRIEDHIASLDAELPNARASEDVRYIQRVELGVFRSKALIHVLETDALEWIMSIRLVARQLGYAREGKMV